MSKIIRLGGAIHLVYLTMEVREQNIWDIETFLVAITLITLWKIKGLAVHGKNQKNIFKIYQYLKMKWPRLLPLVIKKPLREQCIGGRITFHITRRDIDISLEIGTCRALDMVILV